VVPTASAFKQNQCQFSENSEKRFRRSSLQEFNRSVEPPGVLDPCVSSAAWCLFFATGGKISVIRRAGLEPLPSLAGRARRSRRALNPAG
jgi:hypothetical protein